MFKSVADDFNDRTEPKVVCTPGQEFCTTRLSFEYYVTLAEATSTTLLTTSLQYYLKGECWRSKVTPVPITVQIKNRPPVTIGAAASTKEDRPAKVELKGSDPDDDVLVAEMTSLVARTKPDGTRQTFGACFQWSQGLWDYLQTVESNCLGAARSSQWASSEITAANTVVTSQNTVICVPPPVRILPRLFFFLITLIIT
jgi:hypothetical protein